MLADYFPIVELARPTQLLEETNKLIKDFVEWLSILNITTLINWDEKSNKIYVCKHLQLANKIRNLKENLVSTNMEKKKSIYLLYYIKSCLIIQWCLELSVQRLVNLPYQVAVPDFAFFVVNPRQY